MVLELAGDSPFNGPMTRIMYARRHLVGDEPPPMDKQLEREHTDIMKRFEQPAQAGGGQGRQARGAPRREREAQDASGVIVTIERIDDDAAVAPARTNH